MKMAPILRALEKRPDVQTTLIHTGQHYDAKLSDVFFEELGMRRPDVSLEVGSGKQGEQTAKILARIEAVLEGGAKKGTGTFCRNGPLGALHKRSPSPFSRVLVVGDVNSTMAAALAAAKLGIPVAHAEAGLRSFDRSMPEEINRIVTDSIADLFLVSEPAGVENLLREGHREDQIHLVGNVMIDTLKRLLPTAHSRDTLERLELLPGQYGVVTLHRPANVDDRDTLQALVDALAQTASELPLVFPIHPRTQARLETFGLYDHLASAVGMSVLPPQGYLDFLALTSQARFVVTDSGGLQEESTTLGIPCLTMRPNTERPITVELGTSTLIGSDVEVLGEKIQEVLSGDYKLGDCPEHWDGRAAERIAEVLLGADRQLLPSANSALSAVSE